jgi:chromosome segregation ATPase
MSKLREEFERNHTALEAKAERRLHALTDDLELRRKMELHEIEERKNRHINDLMDNHERAFTEMRNYYNSITRDNLTLIRSLKDEVKELRAKHMENQRAMVQISARNEELSEPLLDAEAQVADLRLKLRNFSKDSASLKHARARLGVLDAQYTTLQGTHASLQTEYGGLEKERDALYATFEQTVVAVKDRSESKNQVLEKMLDDYRWVLNHAFRFCQSLLALPVAIKYSLFCFSSIVTYPIQRRV